MRHIEIQPSQVHRPETYSQAVLAGNLLFISGQVPYAADGKLVSSDTYEQARQVFRNLQAVLGEAGASLSDLTFLRLYVVGRERVEPIRKARAEMLGALRPPMTLVYVSGLYDPQVHLEVEAYAVLPAQGEAR